MPADKTPLVVALLCAVATLPWPQIQVDLCETLISSLVDKTGLLENTLLESLLWPVVKLVIDGKTDSLSLESLSPIHWHAWRVAGDQHNWLIAESGKGFHVTGTGTSWTSSYQEIVSITVHPDGSIPDNVDPNGVDIYGSNPDAMVLLFVLQNKDEHTVTVVGPRLECLGSELSRWHANVSTSIDPVLSDEGLVDLLESLKHWEPAPDWRVPQAGVPPEEPLVEHEGTRNEDHATVREEAEGEPMDENPVVGVFRERKRFKGA